VRKKTKTSNRKGELTRLRMLNRSYQIHIRLFYEQRLSNQIFNLWNPTNSIGETRKCYKVRPNDKNEKINKITK